MLKPCTDWAERLSADLDHETTPAEHAAVEAHLHACDACRALAEVMRCDAQDTAAALQARSASKSFAASVMQAIKDTPLEEADRYQEIRVPVIVRKPRIKWLEWLVGVTVMMIMASILFPVFAPAREKARQTTCLNNVRQLTTTVLMFAQDNGERLPTGDWLTTLKEYGAEGRMLDCPTGARHGDEYVFNAQLSGQRLKDIADADTTPLVWCVNSHHGYRMIGYLDGHVEQVRDVTATAGKVPAESPRPAPQPTTPKPVTINPPTNNYGLAEKLQIAYRVDVALESADVQGALERAELLFKQQDGFVLTSQYQRGEAGGVATATVSGRVPSAKLGATLVALDGLGTLVRRAVNGEDLTAKHLEHLETLGDLADTQERLGSIEGRAKPGDALRAEERLSGASREATGTRIEEYKLQSRVRLAEITVTIAGTPTKPAATKPANPVLRSLTGAGTALGKFGLWLLTGLPIPAAIWSPVWVPLLLLARWLRRKYWAK